MASGCILGTCFICDELIYEDEVGWSENRMKHVSCRTISDIRLENKFLRAELEEYKKWISGSIEDTKIGSEKRI